LTYDQEQAWSEADQQATIAVYKTGNVIVIRDNEIGIKNAEQIITALDVCDRYHADLPVLQQTGELSEE